MYLVCVIWNVLSKATVKVDMFSLHTLHYPRDGHILDGRARLKIPVKACPNHRAFLQLVD